MRLLQEILVAVVDPWSEWEVPASAFITGHVTVTHKLVSNFKVSITERGPKVSSNMYLTRLLLLSRNVTYSTNPHVVKNSHHFKLRKTKYTLLFKCTTHIILKVSINV